MLKESSKQAMRDLDLEYAPVAVKFCYNRPEGYEELETTIPVCHHYRNVQDTGKTYYIDVAKEGCMGKHVMGAVPIESFAESGAIGFQHGVFKQQACNAHLYYDVEFFKPGVVNFMLFGPATEVDFDPDLIIFVAPTDKADIIMRANSYTDGALYESKSTNVLSCHWALAYPYMSGKVNSMITGMHFGMKRAKLYPAGLHIIVVPFQRFPAFFEGLEDMEWEIFSLREDEESQATVKKAYQVFDAAHDKEYEIDPSKRVRHA